MSAAVAKRYAPAILSLAQASDAVVSLRADCAQLQQLLEACPEFAAFLQHPLLPQEQQTAVLLDQIGKDLHEVTRKSLALLIQRGRLALLPDLLTVLEQGLDDIQGILDVRVVSAEPLSVAQAKALEVKLEERSGKTIRLRQEVDAGLIGGFLLQTGDQIEDHSLRGKLLRFQQKILNA